MTKTVIFQEELTAESVPQLITRLEPLLLDGHLVQLYFQSCGGRTDYQYLLDDYLAGWVDNLILIGFDELASAAFGTFWNFAGEKRLLPHTFGMIHLVAHAVHSRGLNRPYTAETLCNHELDLTNQQLYDTYRDILTADERKRFQQGEDIIFTPARMQAIFTTPS